MASKTRMSTVFEHADGTKETRSINNINPEATGETLLNMANSCTFQMELIGSENNINKFIKEFENGNHRINDHNVIDKELLTKDVAKVRLQGLCDWNIAKSMLSENPNDLNLIRASEEGPFSVEVFTEEDGQSFQEHFHVVCGDVLTDESSDFYVFHPDDMTHDALELFLSLLPDYGVTIDNYLDYTSLDGKLYLGGLDDYMVFRTEQSLKKYMDYLEKTESKSMKYDEYLNHKPHLECESEKDMEQHNQDCAKMFERLMEHGSNGAIARISHQDLYHKTHEKYLYKLIDKYGYDTMIQAFDIKNGIDFVIHDDEVGIAVYGQNYLFCGKQDMNEVLIQFHFLDTNKADIVSIQEQLDNIYSLEKERTVLEELYQKDIYINNTDLKTQLRSVAPQPIQAKINEADIKKEQNNMQSFIQKDKDTIHKEHDL